MKKYIISILVASVFLIGVPFVVPKASASDLSIRDFINLLIAIGVIAPDKISAVNAFLATLDKTNNSTQVVTLPTSQSSIIVTYPNGGESFPLGVFNGLDFRVEWTSSNYSGNIDVYLHSPDGATCLIKQGVPVSQGYLTATLGSNYQCPNMTNHLQAGQYKVLLDVPNTKISDESNSYFNIYYPNTSVVQPSITVTYPNSGETLSLGAKDTDFRTEWNYSNISGTIAIYLAFPDGAVCPVGNAPVSQKYFTTTLGTNYQCSNMNRKITAGQYKVFLLQDNGTQIYKDFSDNYFTITLATPVISPTSSCDSSGNICLTVNSPTGNENLTVGQTYRISWTATPNIDKISIGYSFGPGSLNWIANNISNSGYYDWTVNLGNTTNAKAKIEIIGYQTGVGSVTAYSSDYFNVTQ